MEQDMLVPSASLATAATALLPRAAPDAALAHDRPIQNPAEVLASLMDFPGSVALAELLEAGAAPCSAGAREASERLLHETRVRLDSVERQVLKPLIGSRAPERPRPNELLEVLLQHGIDRDRGEAACQRLADELGAPFWAAFGLSLRQAQAQIATLRWELTHEIRALGPHADQLERLDAALTRSMQAKVGELLDRMEHAAHLTFARACAHALANLPEQLSVAELRGWCAADGWVERYRDRCVRMAKALFGHQRRNLEGLLRAVLLSAGAEPRASTTSASEDS
jgi:hypothetical protein